MTPTFGSLILAVLAAGASASQPLPEAGPATGHQPWTSSEEAILVEVSSGRTFLGAVDRRTDHEQLVMRWRRGSVELRRPIRWERIVRVQLGEQQFTGHQWQQAVAAVQAELATRSHDGAATLVAPRPSAASPFVLEQAEAPEPIARSTTAGATMPAPGSASSKAPRIQWITVEAEAGRWGPHVEADGLVLRLCARDAAGSVVAADGTLEVELIGRQIGVVRLPDPSVRLGHWSRRVRPEHFGPCGAVYCLPFQGVHPEFDLGVAPLGAVHVRLSVPGHGTFEATAATVRIRPYSPVRDQYQQATGYRFFPQEATGTGRR